MIDPAAYVAGGPVAKWIELGALRPAATPGTLATNSGQTVAQELFELVNELNAEKLDSEKRYGLRPHKISVFTAYDFKQGRLKGFTFGGGWRWRSPNVLGATSRGEEIRGRAIVGTDLLVRHVRKFKALRGSVAFQLNVNNLLSADDIIPARLSTSAAAPDGFIVPGGRGPAYTRYEIVAPREYRFTTTHSF